MSLRYAPIPPNESPPTNHIGFDFVVSERPCYMRGSGPPLAPISIMPPNDNNGYIVGEVDIYSNLCYIVEHYEDPNFRVAVPFKSITNWVSPRELEDYHSKVYDGQVLEEKKLFEAKAEKQKKKAEKRVLVDVPHTKSGKRKVAAFAQTPVETKKLKKSGLVGTKTLGRPRGPGSRNQPVEEEEFTFTSPKQSQHSQQQPSLSTLGGFANRTTLDTESDEYEETEMASEYQSDSNKVRRSNMQSSRSISPPAKTNRNPRSRSTANHSTSREEKNPPLAAFPSDRGAVAAISSRKALKDLEEFERTYDKQSQTIAEKYTHTKNKLQSGTFRGAHARLPPPHREIAQVDIEGSDEENADEENEFEVRTILDHENRNKGDGKPDRWYLIQWVGEWDNTWEPAENVGAGALEEYEAKIERKKGRVRGRVQLDGNESDENQFVSNRKGKEKARAEPGQVLDEDDEDDIVEDE